MTSYEQLVEAAPVSRICHRRAPRYSSGSALLAPALAELERNAEASARKP